MIESIRNTNKLVAVEVDEKLSGKIGTIPRSVTLEFQYFQRSVWEKRLVKVKIYFDKLCTTLKPIHFGGNSEHLLQMKAQGIRPCKVDINGNLKSRAYNLNILFYPLDWFSLFNSFEFNGAVYFVFFIIIGIGTNSLATVFWLVNRMCSRLRYPPSFSGLRLMKLIIYPWIGFILAVIPFFGICSIGRIWFNSDVSVTSPSFLSFDTIQGSWINSPILDDKQLEVNRNGRIGVFFFSVSLYFVCISTSLIIPRKKIDPFEREKGTSKEKGREYSQENSNWNPNEWKRSHFVYYSFSLATVLLFLCEISSSELFAKNIYQIVLVLKIIQIGQELFIQFVLKDCLLSHPLIATSKVIEMIVTLVSFFNLFLSLPDRAKIFTTNILSIVSSFPYNKRVLLILLTSC